jgi:hypothetical protein
MTPDQAMRAVAETLAHQARENYGGVEVISVGPAFTALTPLGLRFNLSTICARPRRTELCGSRRRPSRPSHPK